MLGRKGLGRVAFVPEEVAPNSNPLPKLDPDKAKLLAYAPRPFIPPSLVAVEFKSSTNNLFADWPEPSSVIDIGRLKDILSMPAEPGYTAIFSILREESANPDVR